MNLNYGTWIETPLGYVQIPPPVEIIRKTGFLICLILLWYSVQPWVITENQREPDIPLSEVRHACPDSTGFDRDPITTLFNLRGRNPLSIRLISTMLGSRPAAIIDMNGMRRHIGRGDSIADAVVDSIGRGVIVLRKGHEINRLYM